jgi:hypothetical protein
MTMHLKNFFFFRVIPALTAFVFCLSCGAPVKEKLPEKETVSLSGNFLFSEAGGSRILRGGEHPLWFEFDRQGPRLINSPGEASLKPFEPWPLSPFISAMLVQKDRLIMAVNREGFLVMSPWETLSGADRRSGFQKGDLRIYRAADPAYWGNYTVASLFLFEDLPAVLLYRDDFFVEPQALPPSPPVWALVEGSPFPVGMELPAFKPFAAGEGWEVEDLKRGADGYWYYRCVSGVSSPPADRYFRTGDLSLAGEPASLMAYRNSTLPELINNAPPILADVMEGAFNLSGRDKANVAAIISPDFSGSRYFAGRAFFTAREEQFTEMAGYYREEGVFGPAFALVILPDGRGVYGRERSLEPEMGTFILPPLPEGFVYTSAGLLGNTLTAAWEERQGWAIGAAGFMVIEFRP